MAGGEDSGAWGRRGRLSEPAAPVLVPGREGAGAGAGASGPGPPRRATPSPEVGGHGFPGPQGGVSLPPRSVPACGVEDGPSLLLRASPEWWLGSPEGRDSSAPAGAPAGSPLDRMEPGFLAGPEPSAQETPDGPLEPWGWDMGCPSLAFRDEVDSIFPDFFAC
ncbi:unnamed protein product [Pipistrellus nathusii]|uniref:Uncharacterized protein n=1 Tax=Pipistrellus nathusii TaxID=59473 RepID=A0ABN9Z4Z4_PIPNA